MDKSFEISFSSVFEFKYAMILAANDADEADVGDAESHYINEILDFQKQLRKNLSSYMRNELVYFFKWEDNICSGVGQTVLYYFINKYNETDHIDRLIDLIENCDPLDISRSILERDYINTHSKGSGRNLDIEYPDISTIKAEYKKLKIKDKSRREKHLECIENPDEVKQRLVILLKGFYEKAFVSVYDTIKEKVNGCLDIYNKEIRRDNDIFFRRYTFKDASVFKEGLRIYLSYSRFLGSDYWASDVDDKEFLILGMYTRESVKLQDESEKIMDFLKAVGDRKRMAIINILKKQPAYVAEIAEKMEMTPPTVCYHLTALQEYDIVDFKRYNHRFYYTLNKDKLKEWFDKTTEYYLK